MTVAPHSRQSATPRATAAVCPRPSGLPDDQRAAALGDRGDLRIGGDDDHAVDGRARERGQDVLQHGAGQRRARRGGQRRGQALLREVNSLAGTTTTLTAATPDGVEDDPGEAGLGGAVRHERVRDHRPHAVALEVRRVGASARSMTRASSQGR